jgi:NADPH:quinone reductase-like Zn-dependent oxidoreductase
VIRVAYASVNPADWKCVDGWLSQYFDYQFPFVVGFDAAGTIAEVGEGVTGFKVGDRVVTSSNLGIGERGTYAEYVRSDVARVAHLADSVDYKTAAAIPTAAITSYEGLYDVFKLKAGQTILINGGAGGCGSYAILFAKNTGARVAVTCGPANIDYVKSLGADLAINYRAENVLEAVRAWAPDGVDFVLDTVGQGTLKDGLKMLKKGGTLGFIATLIKDEPLFSPDEAKALGVNLAFVMSSHERSGRQLREITELYNAGKLRAPQMEVLPLEKAGDAQRRVKDGHVRGKLLLKVADF